MACLCLCQQGVMSHHESMSACFWNNSSSSLKVLASVTGWISVNNLCRVIKGRLFYMMLIKIITQYFTKFWAYMLHFFPLFFFFFPCTTCLKSTKLFFENWRFSCLGSFPLCSLSLFYGVGFLLLLSQCQISWLV